MELFSFSMKVHHLAACKGTREQKHLSISLKMTRRSGGGPHNPCADCLSGQLPLFCVIVFHVGRVSRLFHSRSSLPFRLGDVVLGGPRERATTTSAAAGVHSIRQRSSLWGQSLDPCHNLDLGTNRLHARKFRVHLTNFKSIPGCSLILRGQKIRGFNQGYSSHHGREAGCNGTQNFGSRIIHVGDVQLTFGPAHRGSRQHTSRKLCNTPQRGKSLAYFSYSLASAVSRLPAEQKNCVQKFCARLTPPVCRIIFVEIAAGFVAHGPCFSGHSRNRGSQPNMKSGLCFSEG